MNGIFFQGFSAGGVEEAATCEMLDPRLSCTIPVVVNVMYSTKLLRNIRLINGMITSLKQTYLNQSTFAFISLDMSSYQIL